MLDIFVIIKHIKSLNHFCQVKNYSLAFLCSILMVSIQCTQYNKQKNGSLNQAQKSRYSASLIPNHCHYVASLGRKSVIG